MRQPKAATAIACRMRAKILLVGQIYELHELHANLMSSLRSTHVDHEHHGLGLEGTALQL